ncbi:Endonuclease/exonuclease/phosphatase [Epithele typhae]|uniref:Endonuclease/exonuclease/phosphatase n=1 Tax=Epithele typhae TaxID=378194 RepID=UPI0020085B73|nr:Endonuclease/exonuclease/phosphatase [Epithele typhae]KAH9946126.1 Endonuclease/exonuclease/phosphatase [Epithele typhae]
MPPKRAAATKRKAEPSSDGDDASKAKQAAEEDEGGDEDGNDDAPQRSAGKASAKSKRKGKTGAVLNGDADGSNAQPTNKTIPDALAFAPKAASGVLRIAAWNICGLAAAQKKGFGTYVGAEDADVLVLTETKVNDPSVDPALKARYPHQYWSISSKKTYSGTAILSKIEPLSVDYTLPGHPDPSSVKGRIVTLEFETCYLVGTYVVNAGVGLKTLDAKKVWNTHFETYIRALDAKKAVIWTGDLNVAPTELDLANPKTNWNKTPGYTEAETRAYGRVLNAPESDAHDASAPRFVDVWRARHPGRRHYTYFSYRFSCREKGLGWRLDMFVVSDRLMKRVKACSIRSEVYGASDHCPIMLEVTGPL